MPRRSYRPGRTPPKVKPWYERDGGNRLEHDRALTAEPYPDLSYRIDSEAGRAFLEGSFTLRTSCGVPTAIALRVVFPYLYPKVEPFAYDVENRFPHNSDRHFHTDGCCCLWLPPESLWNPDDANSLRHFLDQVAIFFDKQLVCDASAGKTWPGDAHSHGVAGYVEFVRDLLSGSNELLLALAPVFVNASLVGRNDQCPCGSGYKFKKCHWSIVQEIRHRVGSATLRDQFNKWKLLGADVAKLRSTVAEQPCPVPS